MLCKVIATPCERGGDFNGWEIAQDDGRQLTHGEIRFTYNPVMRDHYKEILRRAKRDYNLDKLKAFEMYKAGKKSLEYTLAMRAWKKEKDKFLRESRTLHRESL